MLGQLKLLKTAEKFTLSEHLIHICVQTCTLAFLESILLSCYNICILPQQLGVWSCLGKLFCSILNQRLLEHVNSLNFLHNSQIGFQPKYRTADHVLTLRTLADKYVHHHNEKIYACFVDFKKAFDSVWHDGLSFVILQINVGGCFFNLIKSLYSKSTRSIKNWPKSNTALSIRKRGTPRLYFETILLWKSSNLIPLSYQTAQN